MPEVPSLRSQFYQLATPGGLYAKEIFVEINLEEIPPQTDYPVLVNATYWNGFQGEIESAAFAAQTASDSGIMVIIFPENRVPRRFNFWRKSTSESPVEMIPAPFFVPHSNGFYIEVNKPTVKCTYGIVFTWTDEGTGRASEITPSLDTSLIHPSVTPK